MLTIYRRKGVNKPIDDNNTGLATGGIISLDSFGRLTIDASSPEIRANHPPGEWKHTGGAYLAPSI